MRTSDFGYLATGQDDSIQQKTSSEKDRESDLSIQPSTNDRYVARDGDSGGKRSEDSRRREEYEIVHKLELLCLESDRNWILYRKTLYSLKEPCYGFTEEEVYLLAQLVAGDKDRSGDGEYDFTWAVLNDIEPNYYEIYKVLNVVMNRVSHKELWPDTVKEVVLAPGQFSVMPRNLSADPHHLVIGVIQDWCDRYDDGDQEIKVIPEDHYFFRAGPNLTNVTR